MTAPQRMPHLAEATIVVPVRGNAAHWSHGTAVVGRPGTTEVLFTLPSAASRTPWARLDLASGQLWSGSGMPGPLRSVHFPPDGQDPRWWVLGLHGVGRVDPDDPSVVRDVLRTGIGRYPNRLFGLGEARLAVGTDLSGNVILLSSTSGEPAGRLRLPRGRTSVTSGDGLVRVFAPRDGKAYDVDPDAMKVVRRSTIARGKGDRLVGETLFYLSGEATPIRVRAPGENPPPGVPLVVGKDVGTTVGTTVVARGLVGLDARTLKPVAVGPAGSVPVPADAVEVLGVDREARVVVSTQDGFLLIDAASGAVLARHVEPRGIVGAGMVQGANTVVMATTRSPLGTVVLVSW